MILVVGCGRSGTGYMSQVLQALGRDVGHEQWGRDGIACWYLADERKRRQYRYEERVRGRQLHLYHMVRDPCRVIASYLHRNSPVAEYFDDIDPAEDRLSQCAKFWSRWNEQTERQFPRALKVRLEQVYEILPLVCAQLDIRLDDDAWQRIRGVPTDYNANVPPARPIDWQDLRERLLSHEYERLCSCAARYGYGPGGAGAQPAGRAGRVA